MRSSSSSNSRICLGKNSFSVICPVPGARVVGEVRDGYHVLLATQNGSIESYLSIAVSAPSNKQWPF